MFAVLFVFAFFLCISYFSNLQAKRQRPKATGNRPKGKGTKATGKRQAKRQRPKAEAKGKGQRASQTAKAKGNVWLAGYLAGWLGRAGWLSGGIVFSTRWSTLVHRHTGTPSSRLRDVADPGKLMSHSIEKHPHVHHDPHPHVSRGQARGRRHQDSDVLLVHRQNLADRMLEIIEAIDAQPAIRGFTDPRVLKAPPAFHAFHGWRRWPKGR